MAPGSDEWEQYYQKSFTATPMNGGGIISSDSSALRTNSSAVVTDQSFIGTSPSSNGGQLTPTGSIGKPIRRRSRVSKKTPITLLNANANNFRALVQQFTGCAASSSPISFGNQKGPINLSFGVNSSGTNNSVAMAPFGNPGYSYSHQQQQQLQRLAQVQQEQQQQHRQPLLQLQENHVQLHQAEEQQRMYPFDNVSGNDHVFHYSSNSSSPGYNPMQAAGMEIGDEFEVMDHEDISLHELLD